ncbi:hypothetical protein GCM10010123_13160 [Pilimelia anulata]|uniref:Uncharacterized protein n=1 Tax=Pilimelia anulata TaxID=53371 RepID=A0A8J3B1Z4_9ACTN|nr:hypothetical protein GCM10010123_13160 [Pilimelia anulata]
MAAVPAVDAAAAGAAATGLAVAAGVPPAVGALGVGVTRSIVARARGHRPRAVAHPDRTADGNPARPRSPPGGGHARAAGGGSAA